jgi:hypothetical protein
MALLLVFLGCSKGTSSESSHSLLAADARGSASPGDTRAAPAADGQPAAPGPEAGAAACTVDADCRLFDDYCRGCECRALGKSDPDPTCAGPGVRCLRQPCADRIAVCERGKCAVKDAAKH